MNYYEALKRKDGRWDFTCTNNDHTHPVGYCHAWRDWPEDLKATGTGEYEQYVRDKEKYHGDGHATKEEAEKCYHTYILDTRLRQMNAAADVKFKCAASPCDEWTQKGLHESHGTVTWLCDPHRNRETYEKLHPFVPGVRIISSY